MVEEKLEKNIIDEKDNKTKITNEELANINLRRNIIENKQNELRLLMNEHDNYLASLLKKYNLSTDKKYILTSDGYII